MKTCNEEIFTGILQFLSLSKTGKLYNHTSIQQGKNSWEYYGMDLLWFSASVFPNMHLGTKCNKWIGKIRAWWKTTLRFPEQIKECNIITILDAMTPATSKANCAAPRACQARCIAYNAPHSPRSYYIFAFLASFMENSHAIENLSRRFACKWMKRCMNCCRGRVENISSNVNEQRKA